MGEAILAAVLDKGLATTESVTVSDVSMPRRDYLKQCYSVAVTGNNHQAIIGKEVVIIAVKPQNLVELMTGLRGLLTPEQLVLSIVAGVTLKTLCDGLLHGPVVRAMPNTPAQIGEGMTVWTTTDKVSTRQKELASLILGTMGHQISVEDEDRIDMATAVSGSGPAYLFFFVEALIDAAINIGFSREMAYDLVLTTVLGASHLLQKSDHAPAELRRMVTSPGGTTAAAISRLEDSKFPELISDAVTAAYRRAKELGNR